MKRIIKDFKSISQELMGLITVQYPTGYSDSQLVSFVNARGEFVKALEVKTEDVIYLIKIDRKLDKHISEHLEEGGLKSSDDEFEDSSIDSDGDDLEFDAVDNNEDDF